MSYNDLWVMLIASLVGVSCSLVGVFLVLRKLAMLGDAISHSVLFGIVVAFLISSSRNSWVMLVGATAVGLLTAYLTNILNHQAKLREDASIGVTFTWLFALGVILISLFAGQVDLDQDCVLFGEIAFTPFNRWKAFGMDLGPQALWLIGLITIANLLFVLFGYRQLKTLSFDPILASSLGMNVVLWHYLLMSFVSLTAVASFESVGAILVVGMLVIPPNTAFLVARSLPQMITLSCVLALISAIGGYLLAAYVDASVSAAIVIVSGVLFFATLVLWNINNVILLSRKS